MFKKKIGGNEFIKRNGLDTLGDHEFIKRYFDSLGGNEFIRKRSNFKNLMNLLKAENAYETAKLQDD